MTAGGARRRLSITLDHFIARGATHGENMALARFGGGVVSLSGSVGGTTFARNSSGAIARARRSHTPSGSYILAAHRARIAHLHYLWVTLTPVQRDSWNAYAHSLLTHTSTRTQTPQTGWNAFLAANSYPADNWAQPVMLDAPTALGRAPAIPGATRWTTTSGTPIQCVWPPSYLFRTTVKGLITFACSRPKAVHASTPARHWRTAATVGGGTLPLPPFSISITNPFPVYTIDQSQYVRWRQRDEFGRLGPWSMQRLDFIF